MESQLYLSLTILAYITGVIVLLVGITLFVVLINLAKLTNNLNDTTDIVKAELLPTLKNVNKSVEIISGIIIKTDAGINKVKDFVKKSPLGIITKLTSATGELAKGFWDGLRVAFSIFSKKK